MDKFYKELGKRIKKLREGAELSQENLAGALKINRVAISHIENGERKISAEEVAELSKAFGVTTDILLNLNKEIDVVLEKNKEKYEKPPKTEQTRISVPRENVEKFKETLLYILNKVGSRSNMGETVIYKLLYFIDFDFYEKYEEQLIGATYIKNKYGPTPVEFKKIIKEMEGKDLIRVADKYFEYPQTKYLPLKEPNLTRLSARELNLIDEVLRKLSDMKASQISDYSHGDIPWLTTKDGDVINYEAVFYRTSPYSARSYDE